MPLKRKASESFHTDWDQPNKLAKCVAGLSINPNRTVACSDDAPSTYNENEMDGVENEHFTHISHQDWLDAANAIEIDDRFTKIPQSIIAGTDKDKKELILYRS